MGTGKAGSAAPEPYPIGTGIKPNLRNTSWNWQVKYHESQKRLRAWAWSKGSFGALTPPSSC